MSKPAADICGRLSLPKKVFLTSSQTRSAPLGSRLKKRPRAGVPRRLYSQPYSWWKFLDSEPLRCYDLSDNKIAKAMTKTDLNACLSESRGCCEPGRLPQQSHPFRADRPNALPNALQVGLSAQAALVPRTCWSLKAARFGVQFEWYRGYCVCKARLKVI